MKISKINVNVNVKVKNLIFWYLLMYFIINLFFLVDYPFVHSDEPWLSGLSRRMFMERDFALTEPFFDTYERNPHAIKSLFHFIQMIFMKVFGYNIFAFRLVSLMFSIGSLYVFYRLCMVIFQSERLSLISTLLLSMDIQYIYGSHFARQEMVILFVILLATFLLLRGEEHPYYKDIIIGTIIGISIGIHPNSFIAALAIGGIYLVLLIKKKVRLKNIFLLVLIVLIFALIYISLSLSMDGDFFQHYSESGAKFGVNKSPLEKIERVKDFYKNIYRGKSVTYYLPNIKFQLILFPLGFLLAAFLSQKDKYNNRAIGVIGIITSILFIHLGIIMIGRYNVTSIIFIFPFMYLLVAYALSTIGKGKRIILLVLIGITCIHTATHVNFYASTYREYISEISEYVEQDEVVLSNLNTEYYFDNGCLYDYRNLSFIKDKGISFEAYIATRGIEYIIYYEELDYIYEKTPIYNGVYGDVSSYYGEMKDFLQEKCQMVHSFENSTYGTNIVGLIDKRPWHIIIYKVNNKSLVTYK